MAFSSTMQLADLDYIAPSQACILPQIKSNRKAPGNPVSPQGTIQIGDADDGANEIIKITLADCLACSGCVTTAETLLVTQQSKEEVINMLKVVETGKTIPVEAANGKPEQPAMPIVPPPKLPCVVVSVSEQSLASIANQLKKDVEEAASIVSGFCRTVMKARLVIDTRWAQVAALEATEREFLHRLANETDRLPMIVSSCPGWVCYCEKTHPGLLPKLSNVRSPQAIAGAYIKAMVPLWLQGEPKESPQERGDPIPGDDAKAVQVEFPEVYHISVQPCFDKKLEAVRGDFTIRKEVENDEVTKETDCVLSTQELLEWMQSVDSTTPWRGAWNCVPVSTERNPRETSSCEALSMQGSGGYHSWVLQGFVERATEGNTPLALGEIVYLPQRNANHKIIDVVATLKQRGVVSEYKGNKICIAYGFQHIQNIVRGINRKMASAKDYKLIELMACPDGCLNGGGQVRTKDNTTTLQSVGASFEQRNSELASRDEGAPESKRARYETSPRETLRIDEVFVSKTSLFSAAGVKAWVALGVGAFTQTQVAGSHTSTMGGDNTNAVQLLTQFHDRQAEMNDAPDAQLLHALKW